MGKNYHIYEEKNGLFDPPPEVNNGPMIKLFELGGLQMIHSNPPISHISGGTHIDHASGLKFLFLQKMGKKSSYFLKQKVAIIQTKLFVLKKISKKSQFFNIEQRKYQTLFWK